MSESTQMTETESVAPDPAPSPVPQSGPRKILGLKLPVFLAAAVALVAVIVTAVVLLIPSKFDFKGDLTLNGSQNADRVLNGTVNPDCVGVGGYSDIRLGAGVTVYNADGRIVGIGTIDSSYYFADFCLFAYTVKGVPAGDGPYQYEITHRGRLTVTEDDAKSGTASANLGK